VGPELFNSFYLLFLTMLITIPLGVGAGIYMSEFAPANKLTELIRMATETLASLPSIIVGLFGLLLFVQRFHLGFSILAGALALTVFNLPIIERVAEASLRSVSPGLREESRARHDPLANDQNGSASLGIAGPRHRVYSDGRKNLW
jgi:phosphate transport system permease protein